MNYFEYFSEIEERFTARRGSLLLLSTLDWALIETWREAGVPLAAVLRGIDQAFDKHEQRRARAKGRISKVNGLAWCAQAVMEAVAELNEASIGGRAEELAGPKGESGFEAEKVWRYLEANAVRIREAAQDDGPGQDSMHETAKRLEELSAEMRVGQHSALEDLDRTLTVLEDQLKARLLASLTEAELMAARQSAEQELAPYRAKLGAVQLRQVRDQYLHKRLFELRRLPRLSLFYMSMEEQPGSATGAGEELG